jgi:hypothetical protein
MKLLETSMEIRKIMPNIYLPPVVVIPSALEISAISNSNPMVVTADPNADQANTYIVGMVVRFNVPVSYGMYQVNGLTAMIVGINGDQFSINIDSSMFDPFVIPNPNLLPTPIQPATFSPSGSRNLQYNNSTNNVPFQSLSNVGN